MATISLVVKFVNDKKKVAVSKV